MITRFILAITLCVSPLFASAVCKGTDDTTANGTWSGTTCTGGSHPIHYIVSNDGESTTNMRLLVQAVVDDSQRGDTIKFKAGDTFAVSTSSAPYGVVVRRRPGSSGYLTLTTTEDAKLPASGTRITPAYIPLMPTFTGPTGATGSFAIAILGAKDSYAEHVIIRGLHFTPGTDPTTTYTNNSYGMLKIGPSGSYQTNAAQIVQDDRMTSTEANPIPSIGATTVHVKNATYLSAGMQIAIGSYSTSSATSFNQPIYTIASVNTSNASDHTITLSSAISATPGNGWVFVMPPQASATEAERAAQLPDDIIVQHCVFDNPGQKYSSRLMSLNGQAVTIRDNFLSGASHGNNSDSQVIGGSNNYGPTTIENNFLDGGSETIMFGGSWSSTDSASIGATIRYNFLGHQLERDQVGSWRQLDPTSAYQIPSLMSMAGLPAFSPRIVFKGRVLHEASGTNYFLATNTGVVGTTIPNFAGVASGGFIYDGDTSRPGTTVCNGVTYDGDGVCWKNNAGLRPLIKNNFELKSGKNITLQYNVFDGFGPAHPYNGSQYTMVNIKSSAQSRTGSLCDEAANGVLPFPDCNRPEVTNIQFRNNILRNDYAGGITFLGAQVTNTSAVVGNYKFIGNLVALQTPPMTSQLIGTASGPAYYKHLVVTENQQGTPWNDMLIQNNTFWIPNWLHTYPITLGGSTGGGFGGTRDFSGNVVARGSSTTGFNQGTTGVSSNEATNSDYDGLNLFLNFIAGGTLGKNVMLGSLKSVFPSGDKAKIWNGCSVDESLETACNGAAQTAIDWSSVFRNANRGDFRLLNTHMFKRAGSGGADIGADPAQLPMIKSLTVAASDREVLFRYTLTPVIQSIPCVVEINTAPDFESGDYVAELASIDTYYGQDSDNANRFPRSGARRVIAMGHTVNLSADTYYHYRLHCGGDTLRGSFSTQAALTGTTSVNFPQNTATELTWGYTYSRSGNSLSGGATVTCSGSICAATVTRGRVIYYRYDSGPVRSMLVQ